MFNQIYTIIHRPEDPIIKIVKIRSILNDLKSRAVISDKLINSLIYTLDDDHISPLFEEDLDRLKEQVLSSYEKWEEITRALAQGVDDATLKGKILEWSQMGVLPASNKKQVTQISKMPSYDNIDVSKIYLISSSNIVGEKEDGITEENIKKVESLLLQTEPINFDQGTVALFKKYIAFIKEKNPNAAKLASLTFATQGSSLMTALVTRILFMSLKN